MQAMGGELVPRHGAGAKLVCHHSSSSSDCSSGGGGGNSGSLTHRLSCFRPCWYTRLRHAASVPTVAGSPANPAPWPGCCPWPAPHCCRCCMLTRPCTRAWQQASPPPRRHFVAPSPWWGRHASPRWRHPCTPGGAWQRGQVWQRGRRGLGKVRRPGRGKGCASRARGSSLAGSRGHGLALPHRADAGGQPLLLLQPWWRWERSRWGLGALAPWVQAHMSSLGACCTRGLLVRARRSSCRARERNRRQRWE